MQQLLATAGSLPGPRIDVPAFKRAPDPRPPAQAASDARAAQAAIDEHAARAEIARLRADVHRCLAGLSRSMEERFPPAIEAARRAWERADDLVLVDRALGVAIADARRALEAALSSPAPTVRAVATEGLLVLDAACGLAGLAERRLASLIRLWVRTGEEELLPGGRPFLDLAPALAEAARAWA